MAFAKNMASIDVLEGEGWNRSFEACLRLCTSATLSAPYLINTPKIFPIPSAAAPHNTPAAALSHHGRHFCSNRDTFTTSRSHDASSTTAHHERAYIHSTPARVLAPIPLASFHC